MFVLSTNVPFFQIPVVDRSLDGLHVFNGAFEFGKDLEWLTGAPRLYIGEFAPDLQPYILYSIPLDIIGDG